MANTNDFYDDFFKEKSQKFKKYKFKRCAKFISGEKPNFFEFLKKFSDKNFNVLDLGCGSGELTLRMSPFFKKIIGIDPFKDYINTAQKQKIKFNISNVFFQVADGKKMPFENESFDLIFSSRGPLSANIDFMKESFRVLKSDGFMIEETIGEKDKIELKNIFGRGQNYPPQEKKIVSVQRLLKQLGLKIVESKYLLHFNLYPSINEVIELLERAPIIPNFDKNKDKLFLKMVNEKLNDGGIKLSNHRLHWVAKK